MPKATDTLTPMAPPLTSGKAALARFEITQHLDKFADLPASHPDVALIQSCIQHCRNIVAYEASTVPNADDDPAWHQYERTGETISDAEPLTVAGMAAKAWAAKFEAIQPDGIERPHGQPERWAWELVHDAIRINAGAGREVRS